MKFYFKGAAQLYTYERDAVSTIARLVKEFELISLENSVDPLKEYLKSPEKIYIGIFGRFKAGKTSFLNSLIGRELLPVDVIPVTSIITQLHYGEKESAELRYLDGSIKQISVGEISGYVSEQKNPQNEKKIFSVTASIPELASYRDFEFVDTPGLGSTHVHNSEVTQEWLPSVGLALVLVSVDPPLSEQDLKLIEDLRRYTSKIAILISKADLVSGEDLKKITVFISKTLEKRFGSIFPILSYSTQKQNDHYLKDLKQSLLCPLIARKDSEAKEIFIYKLERTLSSLISYLRAFESAAKERELNRKALEDLLAEEKIKSILIYKELELFRRSADESARVFIAKHLGSHERLIFELLFIELQNERSRWQGSLSKVSKQFKTWIRNRLSEELQKLSDQNSDFLQKPLADLSLNLERTILGFQNRLRERVKNVLKVELQIPDFKSTFAIPEKPDISIGTIFETSLDLLGYLIPSSFFKGMTDSHFQRTLHWEVEKNLSRLTTQWTECIQVVSKQLEREATSYLNHELMTLESLLQNEQTAISVESALESCSRLINIVR